MNSSHLKDLIIINQYRRMISLLRTLSDEYRPIFIGDFSISPLYFACIWAIAVSESDENGIHLIFWIAMLSFHHYDIKPIWYRPHVSQHLGTTTKSNGNNVEWICWAYKHFYYNLVPIVSVHINNVYVYNLYTLYNSHFPAQCPIHRIILYSKSYSNIHHI